MGKVIAHVLFDADGVLQQVPGGWFAPVEPFLGERAEEFMRSTWLLEEPTLAGHGDFHEVLAGNLAEYGVQVPLATVFAAAWHNIEVDPVSTGVVTALREHGYRVHLASNQEQHRAGHMRTALGYDQLFEHSCYSHDLGVAKPAPGFFTRAVARIGAEPGEVLLVDDDAANVRSARSVGLAAVQWHLDEGHPALLDRMAAHGVEVGVDLDQLSGPAPEPPSARRLDGGPVPGRPTTPGAPT